MSIYRNPYFDFEIQFPESWRLSYWDNKKMLTKYPERNQTAYDDLPDEDNEAKLLFSSYCISLEKTSVYSHQIGIESIFRAGEYDVAVEYPIFEEQIFRESGEMKVGSVMARSLYIEMNVTCSPYWMNYMSIIYWRVSETLWMRACVKGDSKKSYNESLEVFSRYSALGLGFGWEANFS